MNILGLDMGSRRVGVAIVDTQVGVASPITTLLNNRSLVNELKKLIMEKQVSQIIVGLPITLAGHTGDQAHEVMAMVDKLKTKLDCEFIFQDERLSSKTAGNRLMGTAHTKADIDAISASIILDSWLAQNA